jgi:hypothetical protein
MNLFIYLLNYYVIICTRPECKYTVLLSGRKNGDVRLPEHSKVYLRTLSQLIPAATGPAYKVVVTPLSEQGSD